MELAIGVIGAMPVENRVRGRDVRQQRRDQGDLSMQGARQSGCIHRKRRLLLAVHYFRCAGLRSQDFGEEERLERCHGFVRSGQPVFRRKA